MGAIAFAVLTASEGITATFARLRPELPSELTERYVRRYEAALPRWDEVNSSEDVIARFQPLEAEISERYGVAQLQKFSRYFVAGLALKLNERLAGQRVPQSILELLPVCLDRLSTQLAVSAAETYFGRDDRFVKDVRFAAGLAVPIGPMVMDLRSRITAGSLLKCVAQGETAPPALRLLLGRRRAPWFQQHVDSRYVDELDEEGSDRSYRRVADLLELHPEVRGLVGTSWFYDPVVATISPRLAYFGHTFARGALLLRHGPGAIHTARATQTSPTRRRLVEEGKYTPICYSMVWPRENLMRWARQGA